MNRMSRGTRSRSLRFRMIAWTGGTIAVGLILLTSLVTWRTSAVVEKEAVSVGRLQAEVAASRL